MYHARLLIMARYEEREESYDLLNQYLQEIARVPRLTPEREKELGRRIQENRYPLVTALPLRRACLRLGA